MNEKRKEYLKEYRKRPDVRLKQSKWFKKWYEKNKHKRKIKYSSIILYRNNHPDRVTAMWKVQEAIRQEKLLKPNKCSVCSQEKYLNAHHSDYSKPLDILWVCASCHKKIHLGFIKLVPPNENNK